MAHPLRAIVDAALKIERTKIDLGFAARCAFGVALPLAIGEVAGDPAYGVAAAAGALNTGFASMQGVYRTRAAAMIFTAAFMALASFIGSLAEGSFAAGVIVTALAGYCYGIVASLGPSASSVALNAIVALVVLGRFHLGVGAALVQALLIFAGGAVQTLLLIGVWPFRRYSAERKALATAYSSLAQTARSLAAGDLALPQAAAIASVHATLGDPQPFARRGDIAVFSALLDEAERIRLSLAALATDRQRFQTLGARRADTRVRAALEACAAPLDDLAAALLEARAPRAHADEWLRIEEFERELRDAPGVLGASVMHELRAVFGQLRAAWRIATVPEGPSRETEVETSRTHAPARVKFPTLSESVARMRANLSPSSAYGRHAIRAGVTLGIAAVGARYISADRGYWVTLTAALVLRPDFTTTFSRGLARFGGTIIGALVAAGIALWLHPSNHLDAVLAAGFAALAYLAFSANYGLFSLAVTGYVVFLLAVAGQSDVEAVHQRLIATASGGALATIAMLLWPTWEGEHVRERIAEYLDAQCAFARSIIEGYIDPDARDFDAIHSAQVAAWTARIAAEASVDRAVAEPERGSDLAAQTMIGILAASRRVALELLGLDNALAHADERKRPSLNGFRDAFVATYALAAGNLRRDREAMATVAPDLRDAYREAFGDEPPSHDDAGFALVRNAGDELVDAANTLLALTAEQGK